MAETRIQYRLPDPSYEALTWMLNDEHSPASSPPLLAGSQMMMGPTPGPGELPASLSVNGYNYQRMDGMAAGAFFPGAPSPKTVESLTRWRQEWLPQVEKGAAALESFQASTVASGDWEKTTEEQEQEFRRIFRGVHMNAVLLARAAVAKFQEAYVNKFGDGRQGDVNTLLQGFANQSLDRAAALWELGRILRAEGELLRALDNKAELSSGSSPAEEFRERFEAMLRRFGYTTDNGQLDLPTWREGSPVPLAMIRAYARQDDARDPRLAAHHQEARRLELEKRLRKAATTDPEAAALVPLMEIAQQFMPNLEDHNLLCDQRMQYASRMRWLSVGRVLQDRGLAKNEGDVFFYRRPELLRALEKGVGLPQEELQRRRYLQEQYRLHPPPLFLGKPPEDMKSWHEIPHEAQQGRVVRGIPASAGSYQGRARVIEGLAETSKLQEGEVMVVRTATPSWTPYFAVIGALVTNSGGALSHCAIVAREFGIPAVVGTKNGTTLIPDGATVTVDGSAGLVFIE